MKIWITGGNGFIARNLSDALKYRFTIVSSNRQTVDLLDAEKVAVFMKRQGFDVVIHTATYDAAPTFSKKNPDKVLENNLRMFFNIARCEGDFGKMIYFGSGAEYDRQHWKPKMKESYFDCHIPQDQYGFSKYLMAKYAQSHRNIYNLRLFGVFGKYDDWRYRFIPNVCCQALLDMPITINRNSTYDFLYMDDLVDIVERFLFNTPSRQTFNVCSGKSYEFMRLAQIILDVSGKKLGIRLKHNGLLTEYSGDNSDLKKEFDDLVFTPIETAIQTLYRWYEERIDILDKAQLCH